MYLTVLGCSGGMPAAGRASSGYLVASGATQVLLDCGPGVATALSAVTHARDLDAVFISHMHLDHCYDLLPLGKTLLSAIAPYPGDEPEPGRPALQPVPLYVPSGAGESLRRLASLFPVSTSRILDRAFELAFDVREYRPGQRLELGDLSGEPIELQHAAPNCGIRLSDGVTLLAYTGDTGVTSALMDLANGVDLLVAEASLEHTDLGPHGHLSAADAARAAQAGDVGELLLTHFATADAAWLQTRLDEAIGAFGGPVDLARPFATYDTSGIRRSRKVLS